MVVSLARPTVAPMDEATFHDGLLASPYVVPEVILPEVGGLVDVT